MQQRDRDPQSLGGGVEGVVQLLRRAGVRRFRKLPGRLLDDEFIDAGKHGPDGFEATREFESIEGAGGGVDGRTRSGGEFRRSWCEGLGMTLSRYCRSWSKSGWP